MTSRMHEAVKITEDGKCEQCGHQFPGGEAERIVEMFKAGDLLGSMGESDKCPNCGKNLVDLSKM